jgi:hypothetical protein
MPRVPLMRSTPPAWMATLLGLPDRARPGRPRLLAALGMTDASMGTSAIPRLTARNDDPSTGTVVIPHSARDDIRVSVPDFRAPVPRQLFARPTRGYRSEGAASTLRARHNPIQRVS